MAYTEEQKIKLTKDICVKVSNGKAIRNVLKQSKDFPSPTTFYTWINESKDLLEQYVRACEERAVLMFEEIKEIADSTGSDMITLEDGKEVVNHNVINRDRLRVDSRKWMLGKMQPKKYGDKLEIDTTPSNTEPSILEGLSPEALISIKKLIEKDRLKE